MPGINIQVTSQSQQANADLTKFTSDQLRNLAQYQAAAARASSASAGLGNAVLENNRKLKSAIGGLALNLSFLAGPQAQQWVYPLMLVQKELKGLKAAASIAGVSLPAVAIGIAGITAAAATGWFALQKYNAELQDIESQGNLAFAQGANRNRLFDLIEKNKNRLNPGEAPALSLQLASGTPEAEAAVRARLEEVILIEQQLKQLEELRAKAAQLHTEQLEGFNKERVQEETRFATAKAYIAERAKIAKTEQDYNDVALAYQENRILRERTLADIEKREQEQKLKAQKEFADEQRKIQEEQDEARLKEFAHAQRMQAEARDRQIAGIQSDPFSTQAQKFGQLQQLGVEGLGADPFSFPQQLQASWVEYYNYLGTASENAARTLTGTVGTAIDGIANGLAGLATGTMNWGQALQSISTSVISEMIRGFVKMLASWLFVEQTRTAASVKGASARSGAALGEASAEAVDTGAKAAGSVADIPYVGWALAIAAFGSIIAMVASASSNARALGGPVASGQPYLVGERGPELFVPSNSGTVLNNSRTMEMLDGGGAPIMAFVFDSQAAAQRFAQSNQNRRIIIETVKDARVDLGLPT